MTLHLAELSRRGVFKTLVAYAIASWVLIEIADVIGGAFLLPEWFVAALTTLLVLGAFPVVILSWRYDITWEGIKRDTSRVPDEVDRSARRISALLIIFLLSATTTLWVHYFRTQSQNDLENLVRAQQGAPAIGEDGRVVSMAVLPFDDFSPGGGKQWVADSIADAVLHELSQNRDMIVTAKTSSFGFRDSGKTAAEIGKALGVQALLEGSVQVIGDRLRVTSQFVRTADQAHIWSDVHEATIEDWFEIQDAIAVKITELVLPHSRPAAERGGRDRPPSLEAYRLLTVGRDLIGDEESTRQAVKLLNVVVEIWPDYADAWAWLAMAYDEQRGFLRRSDTKSVLQISEAAELSRQAVDAALKLNPDQPLALIYRGMFNASLGGKHLHEALDRVEELAPNDPGLLAWLAGGTLYSANFKKAEELLTRARAVDPGDAELLGLYIWSICGREPHGPVVKFQLEEYPVPALQALELRLFADFCDGRYADAFRTALEKARIDSEPGPALGALTMLAALGQDRALAQVGAAHRLLPREFNGPPGEFFFPSYFPEVLPERLASYRRHLASRLANHGASFMYAIALVMAGDYEAAEQQIDIPVRLWEGWYGTMGEIVWTSETTAVFAWKAWLLLHRDALDEAADLVAQLMAAVEEKELIAWSGSRGRLDDIPLMILLLNGRQDQAVDWLLAAEQDLWLYFQPLLTSPVYAEFRTLEEVSAALDRMVAWRAGVLEELEAEALPEVQDPSLLLAYIEALARPSHLDRAEIAQHFDDDPPGALQHLERALEEDPDNVVILDQMADFLQQFGRVDDAVLLAERAASISPEDFDLHYSLTVAYSHAQRFSEAIASAQTAVELRPESGSIRRWLGQMHLLNDEPETARDVFRQIEDESDRIMGLVMAEHALGRPAESDALLEEFLDIKWGFTPYHIAYVFAFRGDNDEAFDWLEKAAAAGKLVSHSATFPMLLNLHDDPRWLPFLERIGKSPEQLAGIELHLMLPPATSALDVGRVD